MFLNIFYFHPNIHDVFPTDRRFDRQQITKHILGQIVPDKVRPVQKSMVCGTHEVLIFQLDTLSIRGSNASASHHQQGWDV
jgi:hypothetical protein